MNRSWIFKGLIGLFVINLLLAPGALAGQSTISSTNPDTGETTTIVKNGDGTTTITVTDSSGNVIRQGAPEDPFGGLTGAYSDDPKTGKRYVSIASRDSVIESTSVFDPETGMTTTTNLLDPSVDDGRAQYVINPDGTQESLVGLPGGTNAVVSVDPKTGKKYVALGHDDGTIETYVINPDGTQETINELPEGMDVIISEDTETGEKRVIIRDKKTGVRENYVEKPDGSETPDDFSPDLFGDNIGGGNRMPAGGSRVANDIEAAVPEPTGQPDHHAEGDHHYPDSGFDDHFDD